MLSICSIALWCANNENERPDFNKTAYRILYFDTVVDNITAIDTTRPVLSGSPAFGNETKAEVSLILLTIMGCWLLTKKPIVYFVFENDSFTTHT